MYDVYMHYSMTGTVVLCSGKFLSEGVKIQATK